MRRFAPASSGFVRQPTTNNNIWLGWNSFPHSGSSSNVLSTVERRKPTLPLNSSRSPAILKGCQPTVLLPIVIFGVRMLQFESCLPVKECGPGEVGCFERTRVV
jgi:hypothetical protein